MLQSGQVWVEWVTEADWHAGSFLTGDNPDSYRDQAPLPLVSSLSDETRSHPQPSDCLITLKNEKPEVVII